MYIYYLSPKNIILKIKVTSAQSIGWSIHNIPAIESLQDLTCLHFKCCPLRAEGLWQVLRSFSPLWTSFHLLWAALAIRYRAVLNGEDVLYEEGGQRFDRVRHFHPVIHKSGASQRQRAAAGAVVEAVCFLTRSHGLNLYKRRGGFEEAGQLLQTTVSVTFICCLLHSTRWGISKIKVLHYFTYTKNALYSIQHTHFVTPLHHNYASRQFYIKSCAHYYIYWNIIRTNWRLKR